MADPIYPVRLVDQVLPPTGVAAQDMPVIVPPYVGADRRVGPSTAFRGSNRRLHAPVSAPSWSAGKPLPPAYAGPERRHSHVAYWGTERRHVV